MKQCRSLSAVHPRAASTNDHQNDRIDWIAVFERDVKPHLSFENVFGVLPKSRVSGRRLRAPCPLHGGRNPNFVVDVDSLLWHCHSKCNEGGDSLLYMHRARGGEGPLRGKAFAELVQQLCVDLGVAPRSEDVATTANPEDVARVWERAQAVTDAQNVARWLARERKLDPELIAASDLARCLSLRADLPEWAGYRRGGHWRSWPSAGYCVVVPLYDALGRRRSLRFRTPGPEGNARSAKGISGVGLVMADAIARTVLESGAWPPFWNEGPFGVVVAEGEPDFWSWATEPARRGLGHGAASFPVALGIVSGSFDGSIAARLPVGTHVLSAMDHDEGGDRIHQRLVRCLEGADRHFTLSRWCPT